MSLAMFELGSISERRMDQMLDPARSEMPAFLAKDSGLESGLMIVQYVAGASLAELHGQGNASVSVLDHDFCGARRSRQHGGDGIMESARWCTSLERSLGV